METLNAMIEQLYMRDGRQREIALKTVAHCYEPELFPHLLLKLSDYVAINRKLAAQHLLLWSERPEISYLCIDYFLDLIAIRERIRLADHIEDILFDKTNNHLEYVRQIIEGRQGKLARALFEAAKKYNWFKQQELLDISKIAKDQVIRKYWIAHLLLQDREFLFATLHSTTSRDIALASLQKIIEKNWHTMFILQSGFESRYHGIMDYAYYYLKKENFDFKYYFETNNFNDLSPQKLKIRLLQLILLKWDKNYFIQILRSLEQPLMIFSLIYRAIKVKYLTLNESIIILQNHKLYFPVYLLLKLKDSNISIDDFEDLLSLSSESISFQERIQFTENFLLWESLDWLTRQWDLANSIDEERLLIPWISNLLIQIQYQYYSPVIWNELQKANIYAKTYAFIVKFSLESQHLKAVEQLRTLLIKESV